MEKKGEMASKISKRFDKKDVEKLARRYFPSAEIKDWDERYVSVRLVEGGTPDYHESYDLVIDWVSDIAQIEFNTSHSSGIWQWIVLDVVHSPEIWELSTEDLRWIKQMLRNLKKGLNEARKWGETALDLINMLPEKYRDRFEVLHALYVWIDDKETGESFMILGQEDYLSLKRYLKNEGLLMEVNK